MRADGVGQPGTLVSTAPVRPCGDGAGWYAGGMATTLGDNPAKAYDREAAANLRRANEERAEREALRKLRTAEPAERAMGGVETAAFVLFSLVGFCTCWAGIGKWLDSGGHPGPPLTGYGLLAFMVAMLIAINANVRMSGRK